METIAQYGSSDEDEALPHLPSPSSAPQQAGRIRTFPHVPGNFAVHVYVELAVPPAAAPPLAALLRRAAELLPGLRPVDGDAEGPVPPLVQPSYHVSLSRTVPVTLPQADPLLTALGNALHSLRPFQLSVEPDLEVYVNDERTRTFLALRAAARPAVAALVASGGGRAPPNDPLVAAISAVSDVFEEQDLPRFYEVPRLHASLAWLLGDEAAAVAAAVGLGGPSDAALVAALEGLRAARWVAEPEAVWCRVGARRAAVWRRGR